MNRPPGTYNTASCACRRFDTQEAWYDSYQPGDFFVEEKRGWIWLVLPHGDHVALPIRGRATDNPLSSNAAWELSGSPDAPTLSPSIDNYPIADANREGWHGWLRDGRLVSC